VSNSSLLRALVGPEGPEVGCVACFDELDRFVELELADADPEAALPGMRTSRAARPAARSASRYGSWSGAPLPSSDAGGCSGSALPGTIASSGRSSRWPSTRTP
jgi:hypothetical protein